MLLEKVSIEVLRYNKICDEAALLCRSHAKEKPVPSVDGHGSIYTETHHCANKVATRRGRAVRNFGVRTVL